MTAILQVNACISGGGASRAALRIHQAVHDYGDKYGFSSMLRVPRGDSDDSSIITGQPYRNPVRRRFQFYLDQIRSRGFSTQNSTIHTIRSPAPGLGRELCSYNQSGIADIVHLHWLDNETISIEEIGYLQMPIVWTLHDQWAFSGGEHWPSLPSVHQPVDGLPRYVSGYNNTNRPGWELGPDINRSIWARKCRSWTRPFHIVSPSHWLADCARNSALMSDWPIHVVPNPIDLESWMPADKSYARSLLGLPLDCPLILFGAVGGTADFRKGADLLSQCLQLLISDFEGTSLGLLQLMVFGQSRPPQASGYGFPIRYFGRLHDDISLRLLYAAADVFVIPSRQDNLPNTGLEAQACATPVVAFRTGGMVDVVEDRITGALAEPFDPASLASAIQWVLEDSHRLQQLGVAARKRAERLWHPASIVKLYAQVYQEALE